jgi:Fe-S-cluster containining protein
VKNQRVKANIEKLEKIYSFYDEIIEKFEFVCQKRCPSCCTCNVTMTKLEADLLVGSLTQQEKKELQTMVKQNSPQKRYVPMMTTNGFARLCMEGKDTLEEENDPAWGKCPLLVDDMCSIYNFRPFGCRALVSQVQCCKKGYAQIPPVVLTINNLFLQYIEHVDENGFFGNLSDILPLILSDKLQRDLLDHSGFIKDGKFVLNEKVRVWMVPPEHREKVRPILAKLSCL